MQLSQHDHAYNPYWDKAPRGTAAGFMGTAAPNGRYWSEYCSGEPEVSGANFVVGPWGECLAWAVVYEYQNDWEDDPDYELLRLKMT